MLLFASSDRAREAFKEKVNSVAYIKSERVSVRCVYVIFTINRTGYAHIFTMSIYGISISLCISGLCISGVCANSFLF